MKNAGVYLLVVCSLSGCLHREEPRQVTISNGFITASIYLPDSENGYYRGTRFDWSGIFSSLEYDGHQFVGQWFDKYSPTAHYSVMGPADAFDPINYNEAAVGGSFVKIGIGTLEKTSDTAYSFSETYPVRDYGSWQIIEDASEIHFQHVLDDKNFPYVYSKTVTLVTDQPIMKLSYHIHNKGINPIETEVFNHNFFVFDDLMIDGDFSLSFSDTIAATCSSINDLLEPDGNQLRFLRSLEEGESAYCSSIAGAQGKTLEYHIRIDCFKNGTGLQIDGNKPLSKMSFWSKGIAICPEPYISIIVLPGEECSWEYSYEFYRKDRD